MKHKVGDTVRIKSKAWVDAQPKNCEGAICLPGILMTSDMQKFAGQKATISQTIVNGTRYNIYLDGEMWSWVDEMFEDDIEALQKRVADLEAEVAMLKGENKQDEQKQDDPTVYNSNKHYVGIWQDQPYILKAGGDSGEIYTFCGVVHSYMRLTKSASSGQEAINVAIEETSQWDDIDPVSIHVFDTGKEALEFMLKYL